MPYSETKEEFIREHPGSIKTSGIFGALYSFEESYEGKDICLIPIKDIIEYLPSILSVKLSTRITQLSMLNLYTQWRIKNGYPVRDEYFNYNWQQLKGISNTDKIKAKYVGNPQQFQQVLDAVFDPENLNTVDITRRCALWMAYIGIQECTAVSKIDISDVNIRASYIKFCDRKLSFPKEAKYVITKCAEAKEFIYIHPNYTTSRQRCGGTQLLRGFKPFIDTKIYDISKMVKRAGFEMAYTDMFYSGVFYRLHQQETAGIPIDFPFVANDLYLLLNTNKPNVKGVAAPIKAQVLEADYQKWKSVFS